MLVFIVGGKPENRRKPSEQESELTRNTTHQRLQLRESKPSYIGGSESFDSIRSDEGLTLETLAVESYGGQITETTLLIKSYFLVVLK